MRMQSKTAYWIIIGLLCMCLIILFTVPLVHYDAAFDTGRFTYVKICDVLSKLLSQDKNTGMAFTLAAMMFGIVGLVLSILFAAVPKAIGRARHVLTLIVSACLLVPLVLLLSHNTELLFALQSRGQLSETRELTLGFFLFAAFILSAVIVSVLELVEPQAKEKRSDAGLPDSTTDYGGTVPDTGKPIPPPSAKPGKGRVECIVGMYCGGTIPISANEELVFGRDPDQVNVVITQSADDISRKHCTVRLNAGNDQYAVTDHSRNGTFAKLNGSAVPIRLTKDRPMLLSRGTILQLGKQGNEFRLD